MNAAEVIFLGVKIWLAFGAFIAATFLIIGIDRIDEDARGAYAFRPLLIPACLLIWPLVAWRWFVLETGRDRWPERHKPPREAHFKVAILFAGSIPLILVIGLLVRQDWPADYVPQKISEAQEQQQ